MNNTEYKREWIKRNREKLRLASKNEREARPIKRMLVALKSRSKKNNISFDLEEADITVPELCPLLKVPLVHDYNKGKGHGWYSPTVDRIVPALGYVKGNVRIISRKANLMKSNCTKDELLAFAANIKEYVA